MGVYRGYKLFLETKGEVHFVDYEKGQASVTGYSPFIVEVSKKDCLEEQVKSFIHELLHISWESTEGKRGYILLAYDLTRIVEKLTNR